MFAKVFGQIFDSSISVDYVTRHVFIDFLILADRDGIVDMTPEAISRRTNVPIAVVESSIQKLSEPDPRSRSYNEEGRRIVLLDEHRNWGWKIVNYEHYRDIKDDEGRRAYFRDYARQRRAKQRGVSLTDVDSQQKSTAVKKVTPHTQAQSHTKSKTPPVPQNGNGSGNGHKKNGVVDSRSTPFKELIFKCYEKLNDGQIPPWDGSEGKQLDLLLKATPSLTLDTWRQWLTNYYYSKDHPPGLRPRVFIPNLCNYSTVINKFNREDETK